MTTPITATNAELASGYTAIQSKRTAPAIPPSAEALNNEPTQVADLESTFKQFVGETFFGQLIKSMRSTVGKPAYLHGGRGEEIFQGQLDQKLAEYMTAASADAIADPMFELFNLPAPR